MIENNQGDGKNLIRISFEEASSSHVDDLIKRQMSLRGERGISTEKATPWYYRNWFVLLIAGTIAAVIAWAILEPFFDDLMYVQGKIEDLRLTELDTTAMGNLFIVEGAMKVNSQEIFLFPGTKRLSSDEMTGLLDPKELATGQEVGVYVDIVPIDREAVPVAVYMDTHPLEPAPAKAHLTFRQLSARKRVASFLIFSIVAGVIGFFIGAVDGLVCRLPRRALLAGLTGLIIGLVGGFLSGILAGFVYVPINSLASDLSGAESKMSSLGFIVQICGRGVAWALAGVAAGLGQGIALQSKRLLTYGILGGLIGGLLGGILFDPIDMLLLGTDKPSAHWSRLVGFAVIGLSVGAMIGIVELLARDAWLRMTAGPLTGKEFLLFKDVMNIGSSPRSEIYLFNDSAVADTHAIIRSSGDQQELEAKNEEWQVLVNGHPVRRTRLRHGDQITIGRTVFQFQKHQG